MTAPPPPGQVPPQGHPAHPVPPGQPRPPMPRPRRTATQVGAPLALIIVAGLLAAGAIGLSAVINPIGFALALIPTALVFLGVVWCYLWLDRWEPEPPRLLLLAFLWGGGIAVAFALLTGWVFAQLGILQSSAIQAPLTEEIGKGAFLLIMLTGARRKEMTTLVDCLVYAGFVGVGFSLVEDILYAAGGGSPGQAMLILAMRLVTGPFSHALFTTMTALGIWWSFRFTGGAAKTGAIALGFLGAMVLHGAWNGSVERFGMGGYLLTYVVVMIPAFVVAIVIAVRSRKRESEIFIAELPKMVNSGLLRHEDAIWLNTLNGRKLRRQAAKQAGDTAEVARIKGLSDAVTELAFLQNRIDRGHGNEWTARTQAQLVQAVRQFGGPPPADRRLL
ncbi:PrsW family intramembrane metalloprotease [Propionibacteriaceae bacterium Y1700]|uniref:PrsW family intramembrane metalloprotease n=1 Tax=Microlunatus sp. Y1700 TaxID=3418487 RepID=UPI003DA71CF8